MANPDNPPGPEPIQLDGRDADEPTVTLPRPPGWEFMPSQDSPPVRGILYSRELRRHGFTPNAVVTLEELTGQVGLPAQALAKERAAVINIVGELDTDTPGTVSGFPSRTITYNLQGRPATGLIIAVQNATGRIWAVTVTIQTTDADNPTTSPLSRRSSNLWKSACPIGDVAALQQCSHGRAEPVDAESRRRSGAFPVVYRTLSRDGPRR